MRTRPNGAWAQRCRSARNLLERVGNGEVIPGLYASGNNAGVGSPGTSYGGGGGTIGPAMTFAYLAGRALGAAKSSA